MFEVALELGIRRGELLKLRLDSLRRAADDGIRILRRPDDPHDSRAKEPALKTAERVIPASRELLRAVKSWLILDRRSVGNMSRRLDAARILWEAVERRRKGKAKAFSWQNFSAEDISQAELLMRTSWSESTTYKLIVSLMVFTRFLAACGVCRPLYYTPQTPRVEDFNRHTILGQQERRDRLPTDAALQGIADIYREHAKEPGTACERPPLRSLW